MSAVARRQDLDMAKAFPIPELALEQHIAVLGKTGSGKTSTAKLIIEHVVAEGYRVCVLDPIKSDWWGMISSADGKRPGLPFTVLGGPRGHAPLPAKSGKVLGELVAHGKLPLSIMDMADFRPGEHQAFFIAFAETLMRKMKGVLYLVMEEAHFLAPKEQAGVGQENLSVYWAKMLATAGRSKGVRLIVLTQRTQALHNALLGSCDTMVVHRLTAPADQKPVKDWLKANVSDASIIKSVDEGMSSISTGSGWLCAGEAKTFKFVKWPRIATFDNSATPDKDGDRREVKTAGVDLDALKALIGDAVADVEANDPTKLKAEIAKLQRELAARRKHPAAAPPAAPVDEAKLQKLRDDAFQVGFKQGAQSREAEIEEAYSAGADAVLAAAGDALAKARTRIAPPKPKAIAAPPRNVTPAKSLPAPSKVVSTKAPPKPSAARATPPTDLAGIGSGHMRLLEALAFWESLGIDMPTRDQVAGAAGFAPGGTFRAYVGKLSGAGLVENAGVGALQFTDAGREIAPPADPSITARQRIGKIIGSGQARILDAIPKDGTPISREDLAAASDFPMGGTFRAYVGKLNGLGLIKNAGVGMVQVEPWVWS
jgi:hypothetical protein